MSISRIGQRRLWKAKLRAYLRLRKKYRKDLMNTAFNAWVTYTTTSSPDEPPRVTMQ